MMGETDLGVMLRSLDPVLDATEWGFGTVARPAAIPEGLPLAGLFEEEEGTTLIAPAAALAGHELTHQPGFARISLRVHSSLAAVGLTAAIATALAERGISANVVAAYYHDHVFVPWERRAEAMEVLRALAAC